MGTRLTVRPRGLGTTGVVAMVMILVAAACNTSTPSGSATKGPSQAARLTVAIPDDPGAGLNIWTSNQAFDPLVDLVYDKLMAPSPYVDQPEPGLAESVTQDDPSTWTVKVRSGVTWQDGQPFTADDVKFTYEYYRDGVPNRYSHHTNDAPKIDTIDLVDPQTVRFHCAYPCPEMGRVTFADLPILPKHIWSSVTEPAKFAGLPVGTGPYQLVEYTPGQFLRFKANPSYFLGNPTVDELVATIVKDQNATFTALQTGEVDVAARSVPPELLDSVRKQDGIKIVQTAPLTEVLVRVNYERWPFTEPSFRRAFSLAIDRQALVSTVLLGHGRPGTDGYLHPDSPWTNGEVSSPFDLNQSRQLLDGLGFKDANGDGVREGTKGALSFTIQVAASEPARVRAAELLVDQLKAVGIGLTVKTVDPGALRGLTSSRDFDALIDQGFAHELADPDQFIESNRSGLDWSKKLPYPEWDALFTQWQQTTTLEDRLKVAFQCQVLFSQQPTAIPLWYPEENWAFRPSSYDAWAETRGYGIVNKWSLLPIDARGKKIVQEFD